MSVKVIKHYGRPMEAIDLSGIRIFRQDRIFLSSHQQWYETLDYDNHFVYITKRMGSSLLCTCGAPAITVGYEQYRKYASYKGQVIACMAHIQNGRHSDNST